MAGKGGGLPLFVPVSAAIIRAMSNNEYTTGYDDARNEIASDGWSHETAAMFLANTSRMGDSYSQGFDAAVADWASDDLSRRVKVTQV